MVTEHRIVVLILVVVLAGLALGGVVLALGGVSHAAPSATVRYVAPPPEGSDVGACTSSGSPCGSVQYAVDQAGDRDLIKVAMGVYTDIHARAGTTQTVYISKTVIVRGGYTTAFVDPPDPDANPTTLDAQQQGRVFYISGDISPTVEGLRITGGDSAKGEGGLIVPYAAGGGVYIVTARATISGNHVFSNAAYHDGGGLYLSRSPATVSNNTVTSNTANDYGGGVCLVSSNNAQLSGNTVTSNTASDGGGLNLSNSLAMVSNNTVKGNTAIFRGGGLSLYLSDATLSGNVVLSNIAWGGGGGLRLYASDATLTNNVVADNRGASGSGLYVEGSSPCLLHTTIARNTGGNGTGTYLEDASSVAMTNTIVVSHWVGIAVLPGSSATINGVLWYGNTSADASGSAITITNAVTGDPAFLEDGYHIGLRSAAVDAGVDAGVATDVDGAPRIGRPDIGADEAPRVVYLPLVLRAYTTFHEVDEAPDECDLALPVEVGHQYREDFDHVYDKDWYTFTATAGVTYTIQVADLESDADTVLYLYDAGCGDPAPIWNDDCVPGDPASGSCVTWQAPANGDYPIMVRNYYWDIYYGPDFDTGYTLSVKEGTW